MSNEKIMILKMLEDGKITSAEAARLLEAASDKTSASGFTATPPPAQSHEYSASPDPRSSGGYSRVADPRSNNRSDPAMGFDSFTSDLTKKFETLAKDMEPKIYKFTEVVAEKTAAFTDKLSKSLATPPNSSTYSSAGGSSASMAVSPGVVERVFESVVTPGYNDLNISGLNGDVLIKGYNGDKISAKIYYRAKRAGAPIEIMKLGNKYFLNYEEDDFDRVCVDAFIPEGMFNNINIQTINGKLNVSTVKSDYLILTNSHGITDVRQVSCENIKIDCNNELLTISDVCGANGQIENFNGNINASCIDISNLKITASNGSMNMNIAYFNRYLDYVWAVEASNGKMTLNLPTAKDLGYHIKAHAALGNLKIGLTALNYLFNDPSFTEAKSIHFDGSAKKVKLSLETTNGALTVN